MHDDLISKPAIEVKNLQKVYLARDKKKIQKTALKGINLTINKGEIFGLLGPNGAGKSTFINILAGLVIKSNGEVNINGYNLDTSVREARQSIGVVPQELTLDPFFSPRDSLELQAGMYGVRKKDRKTKEILSALKLTDVANGYARRMSGGMKRRLMVGKAMVHSPPILVLDEPTAGVDVELRRHLWEMVQDLNNKGTTILLTTHYIEEAEQLCDRIGILNDGNLVACDTKDKLVSLIDKKELIVKLQENFISIPDSLKDLKPIIVDKKTIKFIYQPSNLNFHKILKKINSSKLNIIDFEINETDLEEVFLSITQKNSSINL
ncbi:MAG: multidrug ABC transporter ATP-binding protein [Rhodospirillaceae bacterium]|nr:multidrug ABC transporter ATP-binding protein [Rhodospirillaceae bacterium]|tara:strand:+ start:929 stop:1894 length:966 start_codon:yes stop_codon:yes gene_type:complete